MKLLIDECVGPSVVRWLKEQNHDVVSIYDDFAGMKDVHVLQKSVTENRILITHDKDFGELIFKKKYQHCGILFLKLLDQQPTSTMRILERIITKHSNDLRNNFVIVTEVNIRIIKPQNSFEL
ncbi:hypothetical protein A3J41_03535 [candidate division TM6 bacterium RIFCSPHIGHO2_12_FULL_38_8]|nr:MAG: hypothetical protein A3J41_03535 [candidate division TM6 bacterium RIFCSPHIGHO2_12_FULL_38_8]